METTEIATIHVKESEVDAFTKGIVNGAKIIKQQPGCAGVRVEQCVEKPTHFLLFATWDSVASHMAFRESPDFKRYRETVERTFAEPPSFMHYVPMRTFPSDL